jgi:outer membrane protein assembly factor BamB
MPIRTIRIRPRRVPGHRLTRTLVVSCLVACGLVLLAACSVASTRTPVLLSQRVFVHSAFTLFSLDAASGKQLWRLDNAGFSAPTPLYQNRVYTLGDSRNHAGEQAVLAVDAQSGAVVWEAVLPSGFAGLGKVAVGGGWCTWRSIRSPFSPSTPARASSSDGFLSARSPR